VNAQVLLGRAAFTMAICPSTAPLLNLGALPAQSTKSVRLLAVDNPAIGTIMIWTAANGLRTMASVLCKNVNYLQLLLVSAVCTRVPSFTTARPSKIFLLEPITTGVVNRSMAETPVPGIMTNLLAVILLSPMVSTQLA
jgi:hypothetical protein